MSSRSWRPPPLTLLNRGALSVLGPALAEPASMHPPHPEIKNAQTAIVHVAVHRPLRSTSHECHPGVAQSVAGGKVTSIALARGRRVTKTRPFIHRNARCRGAVYPDKTATDTWNWGCVSLGAHGINTASQLTWDGRTRPPLNYNESDYSARSSSDHHRSLRRFLKPSSVPAWGVLPRNRVA